MGHFFELIAELLFGFVKHTPDKMPDDITYKPDFIVKHPAKKNLARIFATVIIIGVFSTLWMIVKHETRYLFIVFVVLALALLVLSLISFSFRCNVTENILESSYWGLFKKRLQWSNAQCVRVIEKTEEKGVIIAIYDENGKCIIDLNTDMDNAWYVVKMAEEKNITIRQEKNLSLKQISHL
ncbi:MAG: hypothetical protein E7410_07385 [Ruminococcaceae bacterium]|nr:hypothetical protein [Oscillospiraceae bacterium]